jgi:hypothetical protein
MDAQNLIMIVSAVTVGVILTIGVCLLGGWFIPDAVPGSYRLGIGGVMTMYAVYRSLTIWYKFRKGGRNEVR